MMLDNKKLLLVLITLVIMVSIPLTILQIRKQQELRGRAFGNPVAMKLVPETASKAVGEPLEVAVTLDGADNNAQAVDVTVVFSKDVLEVVNFQPAATFNSELSKTSIEQANQTGSFRYVTANTAKEPITGSNIPIGTLTFRGKTEGSGSVIFQNIKVTAISPDEKPVSLPIGTNAAGAYTVGGSAPTPTPSPTAEPTTTPPLSPTPTVTPSPTPPEATPIPSPIPATPTPSGPALTLTLRLGGIGKDDGKNDKPRTQTRTVEVLLFDQSERPVNTGSRTTGNLAYGGDGLFHGTVYLGTAVQPGTYLVKVKMDRYLVRLLPGLVSVPGTVTSVPELVAGNINGDDRINILDYEAFRSCFEAKANTASCSNKTNADLNDDEVVDLLDYKLLFQSFTVQKGD